jgi:phosphate transport system substrate-binding protein
MHSPLATLLSLPLVLPFATGAAAADITIKGAVTVYPIVNAAAKAYQETHPETKLVIGQGGTGPALEALGKGQITIAMVARDLKPADLTADPELTAIRIGYDASAIIVNGANPVDGLTTAQLKAIYGGAVTSWKDAGGVDEAVTPISLGEGVVQFELLQKQTGLKGTVDGEGAAKVILFAADGLPGGKSKRATDASEVIAHVAGKTGGIGFCGLGKALTAKVKGAAIKIISLDGIKPQAVTVRDSTYPLRLSLNVVTKGAPSAEVKGFLDFLTSADGQAIVSAQGSIPVK